MIKDKIDTLEDLQALPPNALVDVVQMEMATPAVFQALTEEFPEESLEGLIMIHRQRQKAKKQTNFISTPAISKFYGLKAEPLVFDYLINEGYIKKEHGYKCTDKGAKYGKTFQDKKGNKQIVWDEQKFKQVITHLKKHILIEHNRKFKLYHMTHINNLNSILDKGLLSHNFRHQYVDISNKDVNNRRSREEPIFNCSIHDYVPLYFNVKNAMLFTVQAEFKDNIVILEIDNDICLKKQTVFTYLNAAAEDAAFYFCIKEFLDNADNWNMINCKTWHDDPFVKQAMMSECLIFKKIEPQYIKNIYCHTCDAQNRVVEILKPFDQLPIQCIYHDNWSTMFFSRFL